MNLPLRMSALLLSVLVPLLAVGEEPAGPVKVVFKDGKLLPDAAPVDPTPRINIDYGGGMLFGLTVGGTRITCTPNISIMPLVRIDGQEVQPPFKPINVTPVRPLPPGRFGKKRLGSKVVWTQNGLHFTQTVEIVPSRLRSALTALPRQLDTVRISCLVENNDRRNHTVALRSFIDTMIADNDGALFAAPTTMPGKVLDGIELKGATLPETLQVLERPSLDNPGFVAWMTFRNGSRAEGPNRVVLANTRAFLGGWEVQPQKANGDSACFLYWDAKTLRPGEKRNLVWAYGGGIAISAEAEDNVALSLGGSFEPGKLFTVMATVDEPLPGQTLTLELPPGLERVEGNVRAPVPAPADASGLSVVLWKARVARLGDYAVKVRSSTGVTQVKHISIQPAP